MIIEKTKLDISLADEKLGYNKLINYNLKLDDF